MVVEGAETTRIVCGTIFLLSIQWGATMKQILLLPVVCVMLLGMVGCGADNHEKLAEDTITAMDDCAAVLKTIKDEASAKAASSDLEAIAVRMKEIEERADALGEPSEEDRVSLNEKYQERLMAAISGLTNERLRIMLLGHEVQEIINEAGEDVFGD